MQTCSSTPAQDKADAGRQFALCLRAEIGILLFRGGDKRPHFKLKLFHSRCSFINEKPRQFSVIKASISPDRLEYGP